MAELSEVGTELVEPPWVGDEFSGDTVWDWTGRVDGGHEVALWEEQGLRGGRESACFGATARGVGLYAVVVRSGRASCWLGREGREGGWELCRTWLSQLDELLSEPSAPSSSRSLPPPRSLPHADQQPCAQQGGFSCEEKHEEHASTTH